MKKPFSIVDIALNVIRVCLVLGIFISLFNFYINSKQDSRIVIQIPPSSTTTETIEYSSARPGTLQTSGAVSTVTEPATSTERESQVSTYDEPVTSMPTPPETTSAASGSIETSASSTSATTTTGTASSGTSSRLININQATESELITLSGIGEVKAAAIVEYRRNNGQFRRIEDILNVSGIGEKTFEKIRDHITV